MSGGSGPVRVPQNPAALEMSPFAAVAALRHVSLASLSIPSTPLLHIIATTPVALLTMPPAPTVQFCWSAAGSGLHMLPTIVCPATYG